VCEVAWISKSEGHDGRSRCERVVKRLGDQILRDMIDREGQGSQLAHHVDVALYRRGGAKERADTAEAAIVGHGSSKLTRCTRAHRGQDDRHVDAERVAEGRFQIRGILQSCSITSSGAASAASPQ
jgi:hypothetical protein